MASRHRSILSQLTAVLTFSAVCATAAYAQDPATVSGVIVDAVTGKPIVDVSVIVLGSEVTVRTARDGSFVLERVPPGLVKFKAQAIGYLPITTPYYNLRAGGTQGVNFKLAPVQVTLAPVEVVGERPTEAWAFGSRVVTAEQLPKGGNVLDALDGVVAGLTSFGKKESSGIVARRSFNEMLYVIDGIVITPPLTFYIDASEVECIEVRRGFRSVQEFRPSIVGETYSGVLLIWTRGSSAPKPRECFRDKKPGGGNDT